MGYVYQEYPACRYNGREVKTVNSEAEDAALGPGWFDSPEKAKQTVVLPIEETVAKGPKIYTVRDLTQMKKAEIYEIAVARGLSVPTDPDEITRRVLVNMVLKAQEG